MLLFLFLVIELYFLVSAVITQIFNPIAEIAILIRISIKIAKTEMKTHQVIIESQINECSI